MPPLKPVAEDVASERPAALLRDFIERAAAILADEHPANMIALRGIARRPPMPTFAEVYKLRAGAIAVYPMYRGLARLVGMTILPAGSSWAEQVERLRENWSDYDFFFLHYKYTDAAGEDGDFTRKVKCIEEFDAQIARVMELRPDVVVVTGDHSTPAAYRSHSWHPVPVVLAASTCRPDAATRFGEDQCLRGGLGQIEAKYLLAARAGPRRPARQIRRVSGVAHLIPRFHDRRGRWRHYRPTRSRHTPNRQALDFRRLVGFVRLCDGSMARRLPGRATFSSGHSSTLTKRQPIVVTDARTGPCDGGNTYAAVGRRASRAGAEPGIASLGSGWGCVAAKDETWLG